MRRRLPNLAIALCPIAAVLLLLMINGPNPKLRAQNVGGLVVGSKNSKVYHEPDCSSARRLSPGNRLAFRSPGAAEAGGFRACQTCKPNQAIRTVSLFSPEPAPVPAPVAQNPDDGPKFSTDVAPVLVANCVRCHNARDRRGGFDLSTFRALMTGAESGAVIEARNPDASELILRVKGESTPKMPPGNTNLAPETIARIEAWIAAGALLDAGANPSAPLAEVAVSPDQLRAAALARLSPEERRTQLTEAATLRWAQAGAGNPPEPTAGKRVLLFGNLPESRASATVKTLDKAADTLQTMLTRPGQTAPFGPLQISVYVFTDRNHYAEFVRTVARQEPLDGEQGRADLADDTPYLVALDPFGGGEASDAAVDRSLDFLLVEQLGAGAVSRSDANAPQWLALGYGAFLASKLEPRSPYVARLRTATVRASQLGWTTKSAEALGDQLPPDDTRALGFSLLEWLSTANPRAFGPFVRGMLGGRQQLDAGVQQLFGVDRNQFLTAWGQWVMARYPRGR
ncbi:c-type cytochrome domain-containing protein [Tautonia rosea]|uniref:c-type cytochrome domain-containing protein n=1 Tax=Tautonia rosea TaxID=2728037 RepID=UPI0014750D40|nr:c-type cytochrome domain-containing protein [Tautonia rosea]